MKGLALAAILLASCVPMVPIPPTGAHEGETAVEVPYPPPAARVDMLDAPPAKMKHAVWVDGQWMWHGGRWVWHPGEWTDLAPGQVYAPPTLLYLSDGKLHWFAGALRNASDRRKDENSASVPDAVHPKP